MKQLLKNIKTAGHKYIRDFGYYIYPSNFIQTVLSLYVNWILKKTSTKKSGLSRQAQKRGKSIDRMDDFVGRTASLIFSRTFWNPDHIKHNVGSGRMQQEVFSCLQGLGFETTFAGEEDRTYDSKIIDADLIITVASPLPRISKHVRGVIALFTCNTHCLVKNSRLIEATRRWQLPCEYYPRIITDIQAYEQADYLLIAENDEGITNFVSNGIERERIKRYNNCVDSHIWLPGNSRREIFTFVFWGSFVGLRKGIPALVEAWRKWYKNQDAELHILGMPTPTSDVMFKGLRQGSPYSGLYINLKDYPAQDPGIIEFLGKSHVGVFPTLEDAQPSSLLEMASCGLPIITTRESGVDFNEVFCKYISADHVPDLVDGFQYWYEKRGQLDDAGKKARSFVKKNHAWPDLHKRFRQIIYEMMQ